MSTTRTPDELPSRRGVPDDPDGPREIQNPGDPGPPVIIPPDREDERADPKIPATVPEPKPGV